MELEKIKVTYKDEPWEDEIVLDIDGIKVKKCIPFEAKRTMASVMESLLTLTNDEKEIIYESTMYDVVLFVMFSIFYTNMDADVDSTEEWIALYNYALAKGYIDAFYKASASDLKVVIDMYHRIQNEHFDAYRHDHSTLKKLETFLSQTEDEASVRMGERMLEILEDKKAPVSYLNIPFDLAKKEIE